MHRHEADLVTGFELTGLPEFVPRHHRGTNKPAETRTIGAENDRHVPGEIDRSDRVGVVVNIRRVQPGLAAVGPRPCRLWPDQADTGPRAVEVHLIIRCEQGFDILIKKEIRRAVWTVNHADGPRARQRRTLIGRKRPGSRTIVGDLADMQHIAALQRAGGVAAECAQRKDGARAQYLRSLETAADGEITALAGTLNAADRQHLAGAHGNRLIITDRHAIKLGRHARAGEADYGLRVEPQGWP